MDTSKLNPWNWFKGEEEHARTPHVPGVRSGLPLSPMDQFHSEIDRLFDSVFRGFPFRPGFDRLRFAEPGAMLEPSLRPRLDVSGTEKEYTIAVELPGVDEKDVTLELHNGTLSIRGEKKQEEKQEDKEKGYYRMERSYGSFERTLALPKDADTAGIKASHKSGVLTITVPRKALEEATRTKIAITKE